MTQPILPGASRWPDIEAFAGFWRALCPPGRLPPKSAVDPIAMKRWLGHLSIVEVIDGGMDYRFRLYGSAVAAAVGFDLTGRSVSEYPGERRGPMRESYQLAVETRAPCYSSIIVRSGSTPQLVVWERLLVPLSPSPADDSVGFLIVLAYRTVTDRPLADYRAEAEGRGMLVRVIDDPKIDWW